MQTQAQFVSPLGPASTRTTRPSSLSSPARSPPAWPGSARPTLRPVSTRSPRGPAPHPLTRTAWARTSARQPPLSLCAPDPTCQTRRLPPATPARDFRRGSRRFPNPGRARPGWPPPYKKGPKAPPLAPHPLPSPAPCVALPLLRRGRVPRSAAAVLPRRLLDLLEPRSCSTLTSRSSLGPLFPLSVLAAPDFATDPPPQLISSSSNCSPPTILEPF